MATTLVQTSGCTWTSGASKPPVARGHVTIGEAIRPNGGCAVVRKFGLAAVLAVLAGMIAVVLPAGVAHAAPTVLPDVIAARCVASESTNCWRYITFSDANPPVPDPPDVQGNKVILNHVGPTYLGNGAWWNTPLTMTGNALGVSFNAYLEGGEP